MILFRKLFFLYWLIIAMVSQANAQQLTEKNNKPINILFITADDLGWSDLVSYGADFHETPNLDKLAAKSFKFTDSYAAAAICSPTRASILSGKYPARLHFTTWSEDAIKQFSAINKEFIPPKTRESLAHEEITIAEILKSKGYHTAHVGKWHVGDQAHFPETQGFDVNIAAGYWGAPPTFFYPYRGNYMASNQYRYIGDLEKDANGKYFTDRKGEYLTDRLTDEAIKIMENAGNQPFYLNLAYYSVHVPIEAKPEMEKYFEGKINNKFHHQNATYAAMVKSVDENVGRILDKLELLGIADNTLVIFTSDNGGYIEEYKGKTVTDNFPLRSGKGSFYEGGIRIPTLIRWPGIMKKGKEINTPISTIDFYPTILEIANAEFDHAVDGISLAPILRGEVENAVRPLFWHFPHYHRRTNPVSAVREGDWKLIEYLDDRHFELYNLKTDLGEQKDLKHKEPAKAKELLNKLHSWRADVNAQTITPNPNFKK